MRLSLSGSGSGCCSEGGDSPAEQWYVISLGKVRGHEPQSHTGELERGDWSFTQTSVVFSFKTVQEPHWLCCISSSKSPSHSGRY